MMLSVGVGVFPPVERGLPASAEIEFHPLRNTLREQTERESRLVDSPEETKEGCEQAVSRFCFYNYLHQR